MDNSSGADSTTAQPAGTVRSQPYIVLVLVTLLLLAFGVRVQDLTLQDIWWDEARNLDVALRPLGQIATAPELDIHPPLYFWGLHLWLRLSGGETASALQLAFLGRFFSVGGGLVAVALLMVWVRALTGTGGAMLVGLLAALSPFWVAESQETRMYTLGFAVLTAAGWQLWRTVLESGLQSGLSRTYWRAYMPYVVLAAAALLTHYNAAFVLVAWHLWWLIHALMSDPRRAGRGQVSLWPQIARNVGTGLAVLALCLPILPIALRQIPTYANPNLIVPSVADYFLENGRAYLGGYAADSTWLANWIDAWLVVTGAASVVGLVLYAARQLRAETRADWLVKSSGVSFLLVWLAGGLALYYVAVWDRGAFNVRYASFVTPALYILVAMGIYTLGRGRQLRMLMLAGVLGGGLAYATYADLRDPAYFREDVRGVVEWLRSEAGETDVVLVDQRYPFGFYWPDFVSDPDAEPAHPTGAAARYLFVDINTLDVRLNTYLAGADRVFWVRWFESDTDPRRAVPYLLDSVAARVESRDFRGFAVTVWDLPSDAKFELAPAWEPVEIGFEAAVTLHAASIPQTVAGDRIPVALRWGPFVPQEDLRWKARVALYDAAGTRIAQSDARLLNDRHLFPGEWSPDDRPINVYLLQTAAPLTPGIYEVRVLVYDEESPENATWVHVQDPAAAVDAVELRLGEVVVE